MSTACSNCAAGSLSSFFESRLGVCADCCAMFVDRAKRFQQVEPQLREEIKESKEFIGSLTQSYEAEKLGTEAARRGFPADQNPFASSPGERAAWNFGWNRGELERRTAQAIAVIEWAMPVLEMTEEIARGNGNTEIAGKVKLVREKLGQFV